MIQVYFKSQRERPGNQEAEKRRNVDSEMVFSVLKKTVKKLESPPKGER